MHCQKAFFSKNAILESGAITYSLMTQPWSATVGKMAGIFTKRIWQPYLVNSQHFMYSMKQEVIR